MKVIRVNSLKLIILLFLLIGVVFSSGCGLEEYYILRAPITATHIPTISSQYDERFFEFKTNDYDNKEYLASAKQNFIYLGTAVYYRIYNNTSTMSSKIATITALNTTSNYSKAAEKMIDLGYQQLGTSGRTITPLIAAASTNRTINIRLTNYGSESAYQARVTVDDTELVDSDGTSVVPRRKGNTYSFDFGRDGTNNTVPEDGDSDVQHSSSFTTDNTWYVDMFAVAVGRDTTYSSSYSLVLHLGSVAIAASTEDN